MLWVGGFEDGLGQGACDGCGCAVRRRKAEMESAVPADASHSETPSPREPVSHAACQLPARLASRLLAAAPDIAKSALPESTPEGQASPKSVPACAALAWLKAACTR